MPVLPSNYKPPFPFRNSHFSTIYSGLFRKVPGLLQERERLELLDGDFLDLDWSTSRFETNKLVILIHGLEGNAQRHYIVGSAKIFNQHNYDACAINLRGCSGEQNRLFRTYHSGATEDLTAVIQHILSHKSYDNIYLMGYSLGGNLILKYLGEGNTVPAQLKGSVGVSVPCNLKSASDELLKTKNALYSARFKKHLIAKLMAKKQVFPELISDTEINRIKTLKDFDDIYTSRAHGFENANDYYEKCSCLQFLPRITVPSLILNAKNDSFLGEACYPTKETLSNPKLYLEIPKFGGHVGFWGRKNISYAEKRGVEFLNTL